MSMYVGLICSAHHPGIDRGVHAVTGMEYSSVSQGSEDVS